MMVVLEIFQKRLPWATLHMQMIVTYYNKYPLPTTGSLMTMTLKPDSFHAFTEVMTLRCGLSDAEVKGGFVERDLDR